jgi:outer membrane protein assembly factor BamD
MTSLRNGSRGALRLPSLIAVVLVLFLLGGCKSAGKEFMSFYFDDLFGKSRSSTIDKTAEQLALDGMNKMQKKDFDEAVKDFKKLKEHYPYSKYAILAELKLGDAYFYDKKYGEAAIAYEEFVRLHPRNEVIPYVLYQVGMSHFLTFTTVDRDPEETQIAMQSFEKVMQNFPKSDYSRRSEQQLQECKKRIVSHEYGVAKFYYILEQYSAAKTRLDSMIQKYPQAIADLGYGKSVEKMLAKCDIEVAKGEKKPGFWTRMGF